MSKTIFNFKTSAVLTGLFILFLGPVVVQANFTVTPPVIDLSGVPRDVVSGSITVTNDSNRRLRLFSFVNNVSVDSVDGREDFEILRGVEVAESAANWVSFSRQEIVLESGETRDLPVSVQIHQRAQPGKHYVFVSLAEGTRRIDAEGRITRDRSTLLSIEVKDDSEDILQVLSFGADSPLILNSSLALEVELDNRGDTVLIPTGELMVFDRRGRELGAVEFNTAGVSIEPGESQKFSVPWDQSLAWGQHRTRLSLVYGSAGRRYSLDDTAFFTVVPIWTLIALFFSLLLLLLLTIHLLHSRHIKKVQAVNNRLPQLYQGRGPVVYEPEIDQNTIDLRR